MFTFSLFSEGSVGLLVLSDPFSREDVPQPETVNNSKSRLANLSTSYMPILGFMFQAPFSENSSRSTSDLKLLFEVVTWKLYESSCLISPQKKF